MEENVLGIGSIINHPEFGKGVIIQLTSEAYEVTGIWIQDEPFGRNLFRKYFGGK